MKQFLTPLLIVLWIGSGSSALAQNTEIIQRVHQELLDLMEESIRYQPNTREGGEIRHRQFSQPQLAYLYLSAVKEQYSVAASVGGQTYQTQEKIRYHHAHHIFDEKVTEPFSYHVSTYLRYWIMPNPELESEFEVQKIQTMEQVEVLRSEAFRALMIGIKEGQDPRQKIDQIAAEISSVLRSLPGNSDDARIRYLRAKYIDEASDEELLALQDELYFQMTLAEERLREASSLELGRARYFFFQLAHYFKSDYRKDFVLWSKYIPILRMMNNRRCYPSNRPEEGQHPLLALDSASWYEGQMALRFYITPRQEFIDTVFGQMIPLHVFRYWQVILQFGNTQDMYRAYDSFMHFLARHAQYLSGLQASRYYQLQKEMVGPALAQAGYPAHFRDPKGKYVPEKIFQSFIDGDFTITLEDGSRLDENSIHGAHGFDQGQAGMIKMSGEIGKDEFKVKNDLKERTLDITVWPGSGGKISMQNFWGNQKDIVGGSTHEWDPVETQDFHVWLRVFAGDPMVSQLIFKATSDGNRWAASIGYPISSSQDQLERINRALEDLLK